MRLAFAAAFCLFSSLPALAAPKVVTSVVPVHGIVSAVMGELGTPDLLLEGSMPEHRASFTAQQIASLGKADLVFMIGNGLEAKLAQLSGTEAVNGKKFIALSEAPGVKTLAIREGGAWEAGANDAGKDPDHGHGDADGVLAFDPHVWLDPENATAMARAAAAELAKADPVNAAAYEANAQAFAASLDKLSAEIAAQLEPVKAKPFVVFHDAFQYFERRFGLPGVGSISDVSAQAPSAKRLAEVRGKLAAAKAQCVFREPQYDGKAIAAVIEGTGAKEGVLDPLGATLTPGPEAYHQLLRNLAASLRACLSV